MERNRRWETIQTRVSDGCLALVVWEGLVVSLWSLGFLPSQDAISVRMSSGFLCSLYSCSCWADFFSHDFLRRKTNLPSAANITIRTITKINQPMISSMFLKTQRPWFSDVFGKEKTVLVPITSGKNWKSGLKRTVHIIHLLYRKVNISWYSPYIPSFSIKRDIYSRSWINVTLSIGLQRRSFNIIGITLNKNLLRAKRGSILFLNRLIS